MKKHMKRYLDDFFKNKLSDGDYVVAADMGNFPEARKFHNFIDVGNNESAAGGIINSLKDIGKNVYVYDVCGYIMRNSYSSFIHSYNKKTTGRVTIFGWGSGFSYDGCLEGHYPFDDIIMANIFGYDVIQYRVEEFYKDTLYQITPQYSYVRLYDMNEYRNRTHICVDERIRIQANGWLLYEVDRYLSTLPKKLSGICFVYDNIVGNDVIYVTDQYNISLVHNDNVCAPSPYIHYKNKNDFVEDVIDKQLRRCIEIKAMEMN